MTLADLIERVKKGLGLKYGAPGNCCNELTSKCKLLWLRDGQPLMKYDPLLFVRVPDLAYSNRFPEKWTYYSPANFRITKSYQPLRKVNMSSSAAIQTLNEVS